MKNLFLSIIIIIAGFTACKKESNTTSPATGSTPNLEQLILNFEQKLESGQKDGTTYAIDSAVWYVEALLNYSFCEEGHPCRDFVVDTLEICLNDPGNNGFTLEQLETIFDGLEADIADNQPENKIVFVIDLYSYKADNLTVFETRTAYATLSEPAFKATADTSGCWYWGGDLGMCGPDSGLYVGMDASDVLESRIGNATTGVWTNVVNFTILPSWTYDPNFPFDITYLQPTRLFSAEGPYAQLYEFCIPSDVMDYYLSSSGIPYIINDLKPAKKSFIYCSITPIWIDVNSIGHWGGFVFGIPLH